MSPSDNADRGAAPTGATTARALRLVQTPWAAALLGCLCFLNTLGNDFVYDDIYIVRDNPRVRSLTNFHEIWLSDWWHPQNTQVIPEFHGRDRLYRPLTLFSFAVDYSVFGINAAAYHAVNVFWHAVACWLIWLFAYRLLGDRAVATVAALWFAVHPIHCEAVANIVGRAEVFACVFLLAGLIVLLPSSARPGWPRGLAAAGFFMLGLLSKETAVCYAPVALLAIWLRRRRAAAPSATGPWWTMHVVLLLLPLIAYLPLRYHALGGHLLRDKPGSPVLNPLVESHWPERLVDAATTFGHYARLHLVPSVLSSNYGIAVIDITQRPEVHTWLGFGAVLALGAALLGAVRRRAGPWFDAAIVGAMFLASYALVSNTLLVIGVSVAERLMYWPSAPLLLLLSVGLVAAWRRYCQPAQPLAGVAPLLRITGVLLLAALALRTGVRNGDWASNFTLFAVDVQTNPRSVHLNNGVARELLAIAIRTPSAEARQPTLERALHYIDSGLKYMPSDFDSLYVRGRILALLGRYDEALKVLNDVLLLNPLDKQTQAILIGLRDRSSGARIAGLEGALASQPTDAAIALDLSRQLLEAGRPRDALTRLEALAKVRTGDPAVLELLAEALVATEQFERGIEVAREVIRLQPDNWRIHAMLTWLLGNGDPAAALHHAREAHRLQPDDYRTRRNLAEALASNAMLTEAIKLYTQIRDGLPLDDPLRKAAETRLADLRSMKP